MLTCFRLTVPPQISMPSSTDRVAILNRGKLVEIGRLSEILDVSIRSVEVVVENLRPELEASLRDRLQAITRTGDRCQLSFARSEDFDAALPTLLGGGARLVSVAPVKETLEEHFVHEVSAASGAAP